MSSSARPIYQYGSVLSNALTTEESLAIDRLLYAVRRGRLKILD